MQWELEQNQYKNNEADTNCRSRLSNKILECPRNISPCVEERASEQDKISLTREKVKFRLN